MFMAKQAGDYFIEGTIDDLTFYKMCGAYYVRMKTPLTGKRFWKDSVFERSRKSCKRFSEGNKLASKLYKTIDEKKRLYKLFCFLKKRAILLLKEGKSVADAEQILAEYLLAFGYIENVACEVRTKVKKQSCHSDTATVKDCQTTEVLAGEKVLLKNKNRCYTCAVGPPKVIERLTSSSYYASVIAS